MGNLNLMNIMDLITFHLSPFVSRDQEKYLGRKEKSELGAFKLNRLKLLDKNINEYPL